jgi:hypothetical protein
MKTPIATHRRLAASAIISTAILLSACGTTSSLQPATADAKEPVANLSRYSRLLIQDFADEASAKAKPKVKALITPKIQAAQKTFPDQLAAIVTANGGFGEVLRSGTADASTLVMRGSITQYDEGDAALRLLIGFGAGNVNFNAHVEIIDGESDQPVGNWKVDKNSWALGGAVAASQRPEDFMQQAAERIGKELSEKRRSAVSAQ